MSDIMNSDITVSSRVRLARNVSGVVFPTVLKDGATAKRITDDVASAITSVKGLKRFDIYQMLPTDSAILKERHLVSPEFVKDCPFASAIINQDETVSIMTNEEDHIRMQVLLSGFQLEKAFETANKIDDEISKKVKYAFDPKFGYLTSCTTNLGTGMRASVMMFLPGITLAGTMPELKVQLGKINMTVRGVYGEQSSALGYLYQISNLQSLGLSEQDIIAKVTDAVNKICEVEHSARMQLKHNEAGLKNDLFRAYGIATNAYMLKTTEAMEIIGKIKLGAYFDYFNIKNRDSINRLTVDVQPASMQRISGAMNVSDRDISRADYVAKVIKENVTRS